MVVVVGGLVVLFLLQPLVLRGGVIATPVHFLQQKWDVQSVDGDTNRFQKIVLMICAARKNNVSVMNVQTMMNARTGTETDSTHSSRSVSR